MKKSTQEKVPTVPAKLEDGIGISHLRPSDIRKVRQLLLEVCALADMTLGVVRDPVVSAENPDQLRARIRVVNALVGQLGWMGYMGLRRLASEADPVPACEWTRWLGSELSPQPPAC